MTKDEKKKTDPVVHYTCGAIMGAVYGASVEVNPAANALAGIPFGAILFAAADEVALPVVGLSDKPRGVSDVDAPLWISLARRIWRNDGNDS